MIEAREHPVFAKWSTKLRDNSGRLRILRRLARISRDGHFGDGKCFNGIGELRIGYVLRLSRLFRQARRHHRHPALRRREGRQSRDIQLAITMAKEV